jgi:hypothetical protein
MAKQLLLGGNGDHHVEGSFDPVGELECVCHEFGVMG